jgi:hypothetical protein
VKVCPASTKKTPDQKNSEAVMSADCIFCKIVKGEIPSKKIYEDDAVIAFHDIHPITKVHFLNVPK